MDKKHGILLVGFSIFIASVSFGVAEANPIPIGIPYILMTVEDIDVVIDDGYADVTGIYSFDLIYANDSYWNYTSDPPPWKYTMLFPVPGDAFDISVRYNNQSKNKSIEWDFVEMRYNTTINDSFPIGSYPSELDNLPIIRWNITLNPEKFNVTVEYTHILATCGSEKIFLYALGTGRYAEGWNSPIINGSISGKPWVDVYITLDCSNCSILNYTPDESSEYHPSVNVTKIGNRTIFNWSAPEIAPKDDFIALLSQNGLINTDPTINIIPSPPTTSDNISVVVSFWVIDASAYCPYNFALSRSENVFFANAVPTFICSPIVGDFYYEHTYVLGNLQAGSYRFCFFAPSISRICKTFHVDSICGDVNSDGIVTAADARVALEIAAIGAHNPAADVNGDGQVTSIDALMILEAAAGGVGL